MSRYLRIREFTFCSECNDKSQEQIMNAAGKILESGSLTINAEGILTRRSIYSFGTSSAKLGQLRFRL